MSRDRLNRLDIVAALLSEHVVEPRWSLAATPLPEGDAMFVGAVALLSARPKALVPGVALGVLGDSTNNIIPLRALGNVADDGAQVKAELCALVDGALAAARGQPPPVRPQAALTDETYPADWRHVTLHVSPTMETVHTDGDHEVWNKLCAKALSPKPQVGVGDFCPACARTGKMPAKEGEPSGAKPCSVCGRDFRNPHGDPFAAALSDMTCDKCGERLLVGAWVCLHCKHDHGEENAAPPREEPTNG
jgi:hypothetical protein